jgi:putative nucleotidyltransferase with HDIG domain
MDPGKVTDELRAKVREELPEAVEIRDPKVRDRVIEAWALALASSSFRAIAEIEPSGNPGVNTLRRGTQTDHIRGVTRLAIAMADQLGAQLPDLRIDRDVLIAGALCHDIGKPWEFDPRNRERWESRPRKAGLPSIRHPAFGVHVCLTAGLPEEVAHCAAAHFRRGRAPGALAREHDRAPRRLRILGHRARRRPPRSREHRRAQGPALNATRLAPASS